MPREGDVIVEVREHGKTVVKSEEPLVGGETYRNLLSRQALDLLVEKRTEHDSWIVLDRFCRRHLDDEVSPDGARKIRFIPETLAPEVPPMDPYPFKPFSLSRLGNGTIEYKRNTSEEF